MPATAFDKATLLVVDDNSTALLTAPGDAPALAAAVESLARNPARRAELGTAARARALELFSAAVIVPQYEALYRRVCAETV